MESIKATLWYPRVEGNANEVVVELYDVRAADDLYITYDFERDGWSIKQQAYTEHEGYDEPYGEPTEVAFLKPWRSPTNS